MTEACPRKNMMAEATDQKDPPNMPFLLNKLLGRPCESGKA